MQDLSKMKAYHLSLNALLWSESRLACGLGSENPGMSMGGGKRLDVQGSVQVRSNEVSILHFGGGGVCLSVWQIERKKNYKSVLFWLLSHEKHTSV